MSEYGTTPTGRQRKKPQMAHANIRLPVWVLEFYKQQPNYTRVMREVLTMHAQEQQTKSEN